LFAVFIWQSTTIVAFGGLKDHEATPRPSGSHPLGRIPPGAPQPRIVIVDDECVIDTPVTPGERVVLTTVGIEHEVAGQTEFHPLVSIAVDKTFPEAPDGQWMAVWNLGMKSPGLLSRMRALLPGYTARKRARGSEVQKLETELKKLHHTEREGEVKVPSPYMKATHLYRRSVTGLMLSGIARGLHWADVFYPAQLLFRNYLLRRKDYSERAFQQTYVGLTWYNDLSSATAEPALLSPDAIQDLKFRLLVNRRALGRWVDYQMRDEFVYQFENEMRDQLWGTSCFLASAANEYHLGYEELDRITESSVPLALGGVLYYDPALAPAPDQVRWAAMNPFDLTYNPFTDPAVRRAAEAAPGSPIPLALYVYQSHHALKPIIAVDFFRPDNPRRRESATYWRKLANEAVAASGLGSLPTMLNRALNFSANRKTYTWFSAKGPALGVEEMRLSLQGHLYFQPDKADELLDQLDRRMVNPLIQPGRLQRVRAQLDYEALLANGGTAVLTEARRVREKLMRPVTGNRDRPLATADYEAYRRYLHRQPGLRTIEIFLGDPSASSVPTEQVIEALESLAAEADERDQETIHKLMPLRRRLEERRRAQEKMNRPVDSQLNELMARTDATLERLYEASGKAPSALQHDLAELAQRQAKQEAQAQARWQKQHARRFAKELDRQTKFLEQFTRSGDLTLFSPWYIARALEFFRQVPAAMDINPAVAAKYREQERQVQVLLNQVEQTLAAYRPPAEAEWLEADRFYCLESVREVQTALVAATPPRPPFPPATIIGVGAGGRP
jgi:hypothetical protein